MFVWHSGWVLRCCHKACTHCVCVCSKPTATENTIASLKQAGAHGADYVEFDVQLTKDLVPVVYHDFAVCTTLARVSLPLPPRSLFLLSLPPHPSAYHSSLLLPHTS